MKKLWITGILTALLIAGLNNANAQVPSPVEKAGKKAEIKDLIANKDYVFELIRSKNDTSDSVSYHKYHIAIYKDTLIAFLPSKPDSIKFNTTSYSYNSSQDANGHYTVIIRPNTNMSNTRELKLDITGQGTATLTVFLPNRKPIFYQGYIKQEDY